jgi:2-oxo-3-hexenedioate decarboxylase
MPAGNREFRRSLLISHAIAAELLEALDQGKVIPSIVARRPHFDDDAAYRVAADIVSARRRRGEQTVGRKIGFTNRSIWPEYGATAPIWAHVYDGSVQDAADDRAVVSLRGSVQPRLEPEIAFRLKAALPAGIDDPERVLAAVEWMAPSFEIVDCHFADWKFSPPESVADFSFHWRLIVGARCPIRSPQIPALIEQVRDCRVVLSRNGQEADRGVGANALGHPAAALAHLVRVLARQPQFEPLAPGEVVTTGTLTAAMPIRPGERWSSRYEGLPGVAGLTLHFTS